MRLRLAAALATIVAWLAPAPVDTPALAAAKRPPNVLWVVWDTVRADRLSLYGYGVPTTPRLAEWARAARVFDDCIATASSTIPSHASMFTGLLPTEHGANNLQKVLARDHVTIAELLRNWGYQTYLFAANPHISAELSFDQGFQLAEHPWQERYRDEAIRIVKTKVAPGDKTSELSERIRAPSGEELGPWSIKASGELARPALEAWLAKRDPERPWFAFLNYMEAHRPFLPSEAHRRRVMSPAQVARSYQVDRSWLPMWSYVFGLHEYTDEELAVMAATYDATLAELDDLFAELIGSLRAKGLLEDTIVVLTSDHGEHLGEHHMLDHQYSLYNGLIRVPLVVWYPARVPAGRDASPVVTFDLFPTLLELTGVEDPDSAGKSARSLLRPDRERVRLAEYPASMPGPIEMVQGAHPKWDPTRWRRTLRALVAGDRKLIWSSDGAHELYDFVGDRAESRNLVGAQPEVAARLIAQLDGVVQALAPRFAAPAGGEALSDEQRRRLESLGYIEPAGGGAPR
jgi:arylsulfatase A-like enzyme